MINEQDNISKDGYILVGFILGMIVTSLIILALQQI